MGSRLHTNCGICAEKNNEWFGKGWRLCLVSLFWSRTGPGGARGGETVAMEVRDGKHTIPYWFCDQLVDKLVVITTLSAAIAMGDGQ